MKKTIIKSLIYITIIVAVFITALSAANWLNNNYKFWTHLNTDNFKALAEYNGRNTKGVQGRQVLVHKNFIPYMEIIDSLAGVNNLVLQINSSYRLPESKPGRSVVRQAGNSNHKAGFAIDINIIYDGQKYFYHNLKKSNLKNQPQSIQNFITAIRKEKKLRWGGNFGDPVHIDYALNKKSPRKYKLFREVCYDDYTNAKYKWPLINMFSRLLYYVI
jgi:hypothetical protein